MALSAEMTPTEIMANLSWIKEDAKNHSELPIGTLTAVHRDTWTKARSHLITKVQNIEALTVIESSAFAVCLDDHDPDSQTSSARQLLLDDGTNRWYDKTIQLIVFANGRAGLYAEHALIDATVISRLLTDALTNITGQIEPSAETPSPLPQKLTFELDENSGQYISDSTTFYSDFIS